MSWPRGGRLVTRALRALPRKRSCQDAAVPSLWVASLLISDRTAKKIINVHGIEPADVRAAIVCVSGLAFSWHHHPERGRRAIVRTRINGKSALVVLYAADASLEEWWLGSAYYV